MFVQQLNKACKRFVIFESLWAIVVMSKHVSFLHNRTRNPDLLILCIAHAVSIYRYMCFKLSYQHCCLTNKHIIIQGFQEYPKLENPQMHL